jgi:dimethylpropiothetin dethiomethylase
MSSVVRSLDAMIQNLPWQYGYEKVPSGLVRSFGHAEMAGPQGPIIRSEIILGVVLFPSAAHTPSRPIVVFSESYPCLSGAVSENHHGVYMP